MNRNRQAGAIGALALAGLLGGCAATSSGQQAQAGKSAAGGRLLATTDGGATWHPLPARPAATPRSLSARASRPPGCCSLATAPR